jgi:hypothetical protein
VNALPKHYAAPIRFAESALHRSDAERYFSRIYLYLERRRAGRPDLDGQVYLEAFERVKGGVTFLNAWRPATPAGVRTFFRWLAERRTEFLSTRPYQLGQACDGTIVSPALHAYRIACDSLGLDANRIYADAYADQGEEPPDWKRIARHTEWQGGVVWPTRWDAAAIDGVAASLTAINYHRLREKFLNAVEVLGGREVSP